VLVVTGLGLRYIVSRRGKLLEEVFAEYKLTFVDPILGLVRLQGGEEGKGNLHLEVVGQFLRVVIQQPVVVHLLT